MTSSDLVEIDAQVPFYTGADEAAFFRWLDKIPCVMSYTPVSFQVAIPKVDEFSLRELLACCYRYKVNMKQFTAFDFEEYAEWFRCKDAYWYTGVFGPQGDQGRRYQAKRTKTLSTFDRMRAEFGANWTTVLVGWSSLGVLSSNSDNWKEFPTLLFVEDVSAYASERLASASDVKEQRLERKLLELEPGMGNRAEVREVLKRLSEFDGGDAALEMRKWRVILIEELLGYLPEDTLYAMIALGRFWQNLGFPSDSPHIFWGKQNKISPAKYYSQSNFKRTLTRHQKWIKQEKAGIKKIEIMGYTPN